MSKNYKDGDELTGTGGIGRYNIKVNPDGTMDAIDNGNVVHRDVAI